MKSRWYGMKTKTVCAILALVCALSCLVCCDDGQGDVGDAVSSAESGETPSVADDSAAESSKAEVSAVESSEAVGSAAESSEAESSKAEVSAVESSEAESSKAEVSAVESSAAESSEAESSAAESSEAEVSAAESSEAVGSEAESSEAEVSAVESSETESSEAEVSAVESSEVEVSEAESSEAEVSAAPAVVQNPFVPPVPLPAELFYDKADDYFDDSLFMGYSVMMHFGRYVAKWREELNSRILGGAVICADVGVTFRINASQTPQTPNNALPKYRGKAYNFEDLPAAVGCGTLYIGMTGYSDLKVGDTPETSTEQAADLSIGEIEKILEKNPDLNVVILPTTYNTGRNMTGAWGDPRFDNGNIRKYNDIILGYCNRRGLDFVDIATPMTDGNGLFIYEYASDGAFHIREHAYYIWMEVLRDYARKKQAGTWKNYDSMPPLVTKGGN